MDDKQKQFVNELVDAALRNYSGGGPRPGLETRILAGVRVRQEAARRRAAWLWSASLASLALMVALVVARWPRPAPAPAPYAAKAPARVSLAPAGPAAPPLLVVKPRRPPRSRVLSQRDTRPQQFPTPRPLSEQEKLLLAYVQAVKSSAGAAAPDAAPNPDEDVEIPALSITSIRIEPLAPSETLGDKKW